MKSFLSIICIIMVLSVTCSLSACKTLNQQGASNDQATVSTKEDTEHATAVATNFINAVVKLDGKTAVSYMSKENEHYDEYATISVENDIQRLVNEYNDESLKETITEGYMKYLEQCSATITDVTINGDTAVANYTSMMLYTNFHNDLSLNIGTHEATGVINMIREGSKWLVLDFTLEFTVDATPDQTK